MQRIRSTQTVQWNYASGVCRSDEREPFLNFIASSDKVSFKFIGIYWAKKNPGKEEERTGTISGVSMWCLVFQRPHGNTFL